MRGRLARVVIVGLMVTSLSSTGVAVGATADSDVPVVQAGPLGKPLGEWAAEYASVFRDQTPVEDRCALGDRGEVFFLPPGVTDCAVRADQHILVPVVHKRCEIPTRLIERAERERSRPRARSEHGRDLEAEAFRCLHARMWLLAGPHLAVDGEAITVDEAVRAMTPPLDADGRTSWEIGYYAMLAPLPVGAHTIERGHSVFPDDPLRVVSTIEVTAASG